MMFIIGDRNPIALHRIKQRKERMSPGSDDLFDLGQCTDRDPNRQRMHPFPALQNGDRSGAVITKAHKKIGSQTRHIARTDQHGADTLGCRIRPDEAKHRRQRNERSAARNIIGNAPFRCTGDAMPGQHDLAYDGIERPVNTLKQRS